MGIINITPTTSVVYYGDKKKDILNANKDKEKNNVTFWVSYNNKDIRETDPKNKNFFPVTMLRTIFKNNTEVKFTKNIKGTQNTLDKKIHEI